MGNSLWRHRDFRLLWAGDTISQFGASISMVAIPLLAATVLAATPFQMGVLTAAENAAFLLIGLPAGVWVDRMRRRGLMMTADFGRAVLLATIPIAWWLGILTLAHVIVAVLLVGVLTVFFDVSYQSYLPSLVGRDKLVEGNSKLQASQSVAIVSGPALAGWLVQLMSAAGAVVLNAAGFLWSLLCLSRIRTREPEPEKVADSTLRRDIAEGLRFVLGNRLLRAITFCTGTSNFFSNMNTAVGVIFLVREIGVPAGGIGLIFTGFGIGGILGALSGTWWQRWFGQARTIWLSLLITQPFLLLLPLTEAGWRVSLYWIGGVVYGYGAVVYNVAQVSFRQAICPDRLLGRMNASIRFLVWGTIPLGGLTGGALAEWIGARGTLWVAGVGGIVAVLWVLFSPLRGLRDIPMAGEPASDAPSTTVR
jgi:MFS family permease